MQRVLFVLLVAVATAYTPPSVSGVPKRGNLRKAVALKGRTTIGNLGDTTPSHIVPKRGNLRKAVAVKDRTTIGNLVDTMPSVYVVPQRGNLRKAVSPALKDITTVGNLVVPVRIPVDRCNGVNMRVCLAQLTLFVQLIISAKFTRKTPTHKPRTWA